MQAGETVGGLAGFVEGLGLVDHHVHGALRASVPRTSFETMLTEAPTVPVDGTIWDSQVGFAIRRWCPPLLDLPEHVDADAYWSRRCELGEEEVNRRLLAASGTAAWIVETGYLGDQVMGVGEMAQASRADAHEVVRLETIAEGLLLHSRDAAAFVASYPSVLADAARGSVGTKSVMAYRSGFRVSAERPSLRDVVDAVGRELRRAQGERPRITDPLLLRHLQWCAIDLGLPLQIHCGYGDPDLDLDAANPVALMPWLRAVEPSHVPVVLLHNYPYHREAGYLAQVFSNVYFDVGLAVNYLGAASPRLIAESLELGPFHKQMFSSDAWGPAELHYLGARLWRRGVASVVGEWVADGQWSDSDARRVLTLLASENARRVYQL